MTRAIQVHFVPPGGRIACRSRGSHMRTTDVIDAVTCKACVYRLFVTGRVDRSDPRITPAMLQHALR